MTMRPALSICIPTFQRAAWLRQSLDVALPFLATNNAEICLSDNASTNPDKKQLLETLISAANPRLRIFLQRENVGLERNMAHAISMASGEYVFPMGDDDQLVPAELASIVSCLRADHPALLILDGWHCDAALNKQQRHLAAHQRGLSLSDPRAAFAMFWDKMPFGSFVVASDAYRDANWTRYEHTSHSYTGVVWDWLVSPATSGKPIMSWRDPAVYLRQAEKSWRQDAGRIHYQHIPRWFEQLPRQLNPARSQARDGYLAAATSVAMLLAMRGENQLDLRSEIPSAGSLSPLKRGFARALMHVHPKHAAALYNGFRHVAKAVRRARSVG